MKWNRKRSRQAVEQAADTRRRAEQAEADAVERVLRPLREMRERNHVAADIARVIRAKGRGNGAPGAAAR